MRRRQNTPQKSESARMQRHQGSTCESNTPVVNNPTRNLLVKSNSPGCPEGKYSSSRTGRRFRNVTNKNVDVSPVIIDIDGDESSPRSPTDTYDKTRQLVSPVKCKSNKKRRISHHTDDLSEDTESMMSNASTISTATVQCVDNLHISEDARHGFDDPVLGKKMSPNIKGEREDLLQCDVSKSDEAPTIAIVPIDGKSLLKTASGLKLSSLPEISCRNPAMLLDQQQEGTDKSSWLIDYSSNGSVSDKNILLEPNQRILTQRNKQLSQSDGTSPYLEQAVDLTTSHDDQQTCVNSETEFREEINLPNAISTSTYHPLSSASGVVSLPLNLTHEPVDLTYSCQSPIPIILNCHEKNDNMSSCGDMKNTERDKIASPTLCMYEQNGICKSQSGVHQETLIRIQEVAVDADSSNSMVDANNNKSPEKTAGDLDFDKSACENLICSKQPSTSFRGILKDMSTEHDANRFDEFSPNSDLTVYKQPYYEEPQNLSASSKQDFIQYSQYTEQPMHQYTDMQSYTEKANTFTPQLQHDSQQSQSYIQGQQNYQQLPQQQLAGEESNQIAGYMQYSQYGQPIDEQFAAEQLASELVQNFGGPNSHMISDILKRNGGQNYLHAGFERSNEIGINQLPSNQTVMHDVDLLNTPQQGSVTYNDIHLHGGSWSTKKSTVHDIQTQDASESPFPPGTLETGRAPLLCKDGDTSYYSDDSEGPCNLSKCADAGRKPFMNLKQYQQPSNAQSDLPSYLGYGHIPTVRSPPSFSKSNQYVQPQHEITKMTFTPREMMESHLSQNYQYPKKDTVGQPMSEMDYSSIYPSREFIDRTANEAFIQKDHKRKRSDSLTPKKRPRVSKYNTDDVPKVPPQMPIVDHMFQKYPPVMRRDESSGGKHKYFVVNPSEITNMSTKNLLTKYIDFLIVENEQVTEISKSTNPPVDIYVTEDMYFMDSLKFHVDFPSRKFVEWVANFYPRLNFNEMKFKGRYPVLPKDGDTLVVDQRPTQQILEDTFYYFQRIALNGSDSRLKGK